MVCPNYYPVTCGIGDFTMHLARELVDRGAEVALFTHLPAEPNPECPTIRVYGATGSTPLEIVQAMRDAITAFDPSDVVIQYVPHMLWASQLGSPAIPILMAEMRHRARVATIFHELYRPWSWRPDLALGAVLQRLQFGATLGGCDRIFVTTVDRKRKLESMLRSAGRERLVELLFVGANASPVARRSHPGSRRLGIFSTLARWRRFDVMIDAFEIVHRRHPDTELVLIGDLGTDASPSYRALKAAVARSSATTHIRLTGALPLSAVAEEIAALDVYLFPDEGGPTTRSSTLPIAFGSGIPVVATCGPNTPRDFFVDGQSLAFAEGMTPLALAAAALRVLEDPSWAATLSRGGRALYERHLSWDAIADQLSPTSGGLMTVQGGQSR